MNSLNGNTPVRMQHRYLSPLRYPGGKAKLTTLVADVMARNGLTGGAYVEPYAGGASVALGLLFLNVAREAYINDLDHAIFAFWHSVLHETEALCRLIRNRRVSIAEWRRQKDVQRNAQNATLLELGFATFFLNRTNRSGIISSGGVIGGLRQDGDWSLGARFNKAELVARIERIAAHSDRIHLSGEDAEVFLLRILPTLPQASLVYLDPPYYIKGTRRLYANFYTHDDHARVAAIMRASSTPWIVSYDDHAEIRKIYKGIRSKAYGLSYTAKHRYRGAERMFFSPRLRIPPVQGL